MSGFGDVKKSVQSFKDGIKKEKEKQDMLRRERIAAMKGFSFRQFFSTWFVRLFYTALMGMFGYAVILAATISIPMCMAVIIRAFGYSMQDIGQVLLSFLAGLFFTAWVFTISFVLLRAFWRKYIACIRKTMTVTQQ